MFCKKNVQNERKIKRIYYLCKQSLQNVLLGIISHSEYLMRL